MVSMFEAVTVALPFSPPRFKGVLLLLVKVNAPEGDGGRDRHGRAAGDRHIAADRQALVPETVVAPLPAKVSRVRAGGDAAPSVNGRCRCWRWSGPRPG